MKAGATDYLLKSNLARIGPAIEAALARVPVPRREGAAPRRPSAASEANLRAMFNNSLRLAFVLVAGRHHPGRSSDSAERRGIPPEIRRQQPAVLARASGSQTSSPGAADGIPGARRRGAAIELCLARRRRRRALVRDHRTHRCVDERRPPSSASAQRPGRERAQAAERALRESEARYRDLFDNASDLVCMAAPDGAFLYVNRAWQRRDRATPTRSWPACRLLDLVHTGAGSATTSSGAARVAGETGSIHVELVFVPKAGTPSRSRATSAAPSRTAKPAMLRGIYRDITERKRIEEQLRRAERMQAAGELAGGVAHEVNNMMTGVIGFSEFLLRSLDPRIDRRGRGRRDHQGRHPGRGRHPAAARLHPPAVPPRRGARQSTSVVGGMEKLLRRSLGEDHVLELRLARRCRRASGPTGVSSSRCSSTWCSTRATRSRGSGRVVIATGRATLDEVQAARHDRSGCAAGVLCPAVGERHRMRDGAGGPGADLRAVLHDQGASARVPASAFRPCTAS